MFTLRRLLAVILLAGLGLGAPAQAADPRPNIVVIMTDDQTLESLRVMPNTRNLIGAQGTTFNQFYVSYPLCCPSRATYLTGQYPHNHDVFSNDEEDGGYQKLRKGETLPVWLGRAGYKTVHIGKYLNGYQGEVVPPGWEYWHGLVCAYRMWGYTIKHNDAPAPQTCGNPAADTDATYQTNVLRNPRHHFIDIHFHGRAAVLSCLRAPRPACRGGHGIGSGLPAPALVAEITWRLRFRSRCRLARFHESNMNRQPDGCPAHR